jgi:excisionase family DNA binding protein
MNGITEERFLSLRELAEYAGLSVRTLRGLVHRTIAPLPHYQIAGKILVRRSEFDAWMHQYRRSLERPDKGEQLNRVVDEILDSLTPLGSKAHTPAHAGDQGKHRGRSR